MDADSTVEHQGELLILTGPPGAGKTTLSATLAAMPGSRKVHLHSDDFWHFIKHGAIEPYLPQAHQQNAVVLDVLAKVAVSYAKGGYFVILDGIIGPWFLHAFDRSGIPIYYVVLRPPLDVAIRRCRARGGNTLTSSGPIAALHQQFSTLGPMERHVLSTVDENRAELLTRVLDALQGEDYRLAMTQA